jgi:hypothetical protein
MGAQYGPVIVTSLRIGLDEVLRGTGWEIMPEGACKDERCVPLTPGIVEDGNVDVRAFAERMGMGFAEGDGVWALGPGSGGRALESAHLPDVTLPDRNGRPFSLRSLRGMKVLLLAWASW